eukprot:CAMPEP_0180108058 /NCGR_PEP_ID=MMETSP0985-20121206/33655_1 /TAXON_ID=483367 /ORGANISM="non described non described, Strain CCMP 2436" /LENGTH=60 /DNA_ID=CAMNT_0022045687 /DNA_START=38 /DNA_END=220 /DNA_ORIENTATION=-
MSEGAPPYVSDGIGSQVQVGKRANVVGDGRGERGDASVGNGIILEVKFRKRVADAPTSPI